MCHYLHIQMLMQHLVSHLILLNIQIFNGVQLTISNIDSQLGSKTIQENIWRLVTPICPILKLWIRPHNRFTVKCNIVVPNIEDASCVLQHLHRKKLGGKRILVAISNQHEVESRFLKSSFVNCQEHWKSNQLHQRHLIKIEIGLREFSAKLHALLHSHRGVLYINGFEQCYQAEYGSFPYPKKLTKGVYLEHEISYVPGVRIIGDDNKSVVWSHPYSGDSGSDTASESSTSPRPKPSSLIQFSKEVLDLLKVQPLCCMPFCDFTSLYQKRYGHSLNMCGYHDLSDILTAVPHVVQIIGGSNTRVVTLTHRAQVKRFTQEIIKILKTSPDKAILVPQLPDMFYKIFNRPWNLQDYGVNVLSDLADDIPDGNICISGEGDNIVISLPCRERTVAEVVHTTQFSRELIEVLKTRPQCRMSFTDFVPAYHRQFGRQCKLSNYGFSKLLDLFESLPHIVEVIDAQPDKYLQLTREEQLKVLTSQIMGILSQPKHNVTSDNAFVPLNRLQSIFSRKYGFPLVPRYYNCNNIEALAGLLSHAIKICKNADGDLVIKQTERKPIRLLCVQLLVLLLDFCDDQIELGRLSQVYRDRYNEEIIPNEFGYMTLCDVAKKALSGVAKFDLCGGDVVVRLKSIYQRAKRVRNILLSQGGSMTLGEFNQAYRIQYNEQLDAEKHGFRSCESMLRALSLVLVVKGFGIKKTIILRNHMQYGPLSTSIAPPCHDPTLTPSDQASTNYFQDETSNYSPLAMESMKGSTRHNIRRIHNQSNKIEIDKTKYTSKNVFATSSVFGDGLGFQQYQSITHVGENGGKCLQRRFNFDEHTIKMSLVEDSLKSRSLKDDMLRRRHSISEALNYSSVLCQPPNTNSILRSCPDSRTQRRRKSLTVITLPTGTTSISSTSSPDSFVSTDEDLKLCSDQCLAKTMSGILL